MKIEDKLLSKFMIYLLSIEKQSLVDNPNQDAHDRRKIERLINKKLTEIAELGSEANKREN